MRRSTRRMVWGLLVLVGVPLLTVLVMWNWVLAAGEILNNPIATYVGWPVACSTRGCVTTKMWQEHNLARQQFAVKAEQDAPSTRDTLTTLLRQHLVKHAWLRTPVTEKDAERYREEILGVLDEKQVSEATGLTLEEYDRLVILPLLQQEALKQQDSVESNDELYRLLAKERSVVVLAWHWRWDKGEAKVVQR